MFHFGKAHRSLWNVRWADAYPANSGLGIGAGVACRLQPESDMQQSVATVDYEGLLVAVLPLTATEQSWPCSNRTL
jgi:hypothetical protein